MRLNSGHRKIITQGLEVRKACYIAIHDLKCHSESISIYGIIQSRGVEESRMNQRYFTCMAQHPQAFTSFTQSNKEYMRWDSFVMSPKPKLYPTNSPGLFLIQLAADPLLI